MQNSSGTRQPDGRAQRQIHKWRVQVQQGPTPPSEATKDNRVGAQAASRLRSQQPLRGIW